MFQSNQSRRAFLQGSLGLGAAMLLLGCSGDEVSGVPVGIDESGNFLDTGATDPFAGGTFLNALPFHGEAPIRPGEKVSEGLDGRMMLDLPSLVSEETRITPADRFFIRTFA